MQETWVQFLGWVDPLEKEMATHSSILAWRIPWTEEPGRLQSMGSQESDTTERLNNNSKSGNPGLTIAPDPLRSNIEKCLLEDFPGGPVVKTSPSNGGVWV